MKIGLRLGTGVYKSKKLKRIKRKILFDIFENEY
jgi:hypothetical protein